MVFLWEEGGTPKIHFSGREREPPSPAFSCGYAALGPCLTGTPCTGVETRTLMGICYRGMVEVRQTGRIPRIGILISNLLPAFGVLVLSWPAAPGVFLIWLEGWLGILELSAQAAVYSTRKQKEGTPKDAMGCAWSLGWPLGILIGLTSLSAPAFVAGWALFSLLRRHAPGDPWAGLLDGRGLLWIAAAAVALKVFQIVRMMKSDSLEPFRAAAQKKYVLLANRCFLLFVLAYLAAPLGRYGLVTFVVLVSAALAHAEITGKDFFHRLFRTDQRDRGKGEAA